MVHVGEVRCLRVVLRNRGTYTMAIRIDTGGAASDRLKVKFSEQPLSAGVPRVMDVEASFDRPGEYHGEIRIFTRTRAEEEQHVNSIPFYALVPGEDPAARFPSARSERLQYSVKNLPMAHQPGQAASLRLGSVVPSTRSPFSRVEADEQQTQGQKQGQAIESSEVDQPLLTDNTQGLDTTIV